jgi:ACS family hexuronate transporter-like MFS transporter
MAAIGSYVWIPYAFAGVGSLTSGWLSSLLIRRRWTLDASRKFALAVGAALMPLSLLVVRSPIEQALLFVSLAFLGHQFWSVIVQTLPADLFPARAVGSVAGLIGCAGSFGAMLFDLLVGPIVDASSSYAVPFVMAGLLHPASFLLILLTVHERRANRRLLMKSITRQKRRECGCGPEPPIACGRWRPYR